MATLEANFPGALELDQVFPPVNLAVELEADRDYRIGRIPGAEYADLAVNDPRMSRVHARVRWNGESLRVEQVAGPDGKPRAIHYEGLPRTSFTLAPGHVFKIAETTFKLSLLKPIASSAEIPTIHAVSATRESLRTKAYAQPKSILSALEKLQNIMRIAHNETILDRLVVTLLLDVLPQALAVAVVVMQPREGGLETRCRHLGRHNPAYDFTPSRTLMKQCHETGKSVLYVWPAGDRKPHDPTWPGAGSHTASAHRATDGRMPWAVCTRLEDKSGLGLYVAAATDDPDDPTLGDSQKVIEVVASVMELTRNKFAQRELLDVYRNYLPKAMGARRDKASLAALLEHRAAQLTILFCDLRGLSRLAETSPLEECWEIAKEALDTMAQEVTAHGGVVTEFLGDAVLAFWGWPQALPTDTRMAAAAAIRIRKRLDPNGTLPQLSCGIGIARGEALVGGLGTHELRKVGVFGPVVNLASRLEGMTKQFGVRILLDAAAAADLRATDAEGSVGRPRRLGRFRPAGMERVTEVFELLGPVHDHGQTFDDQRIRAWENVVVAYESGEWDVVRQVVPDFFEEDRVGQLFLKQTATPRPDGWDGAISLDKK